MNFSNFGIVYMCVCAFVHMCVLVLEAEEQAEGH